MQVERGTVGQVKNTAGYKSPEKDKDKELYLRHKKYSRILAKRVYELKETREGVESMCQEMEQIFSEGQRYGEKRGEKRGERRGELKAKKEAAVSLNEMGLPADKIAEAVKVSAATVQKWIGRNTAAAR